MDRDMRTTEGGGVRKRGGKNWALLIGFVLWGMLMFVGSCCVVGGVRRGWTLECI